MGTYRMEVERMDVISTKPFAEVVATLEQLVPIVDVSVILKMITSCLSAQEIERTIGGMVGELGFVVLAKPDQGPLVSLLGRPKEMNLYLIGNPVLANRMYEQNPAGRLLCSPQGFTIRRRSEQRPFHRMSVRLGCSSNLVMMRFERLPVSR